MSQKKSSAVNGAVSNTAKTPALKDRLETIRLARKLRAHDMAVLLGVKSGTYRSWVNGKKTPNKAELARVEAKLAALESEGVQ